MISPMTLKRYIGMADTIISENNADAAEKLVDQIVSTCQTKLIGLADGLIQYGPLAILSDDHNRCLERDANNITDLHLIRERLCIELENIEYQNKASIERNVEKFKCKIFISHAEVNKEYAKAIINLLESIGLSEGQVLCSSFPGYGIPLDADIYDYLREQFECFDLHILYVLSSDYYNSVACLNEMGAAWILQSRYTSILLPGFDFERIKGAVNPSKISVKLDSDKDIVKHLLCELIMNIQKEFSLQDLSNTKLNRVIEEFLASISAANTSESQGHKFPRYSEPEMIIMAYIRETKYKHIKKICVQQWLEENGITKDDLHIDTAYHLLQRNGIGRDIGCEFIINDEYHKRILALGSSSLQMISSAIDKYRKPQV